MIRHLTQDAFSCSFQYSTMARLNISGVEGLLLVEWLCFVEFCRSSCLECRKLCVSVAINYSHRTNSLLKSLVVPAPNLFPLVRFDG